MKLRAARIVVAGAAGDLGKELCLQLARDQQAKVIAVDINAEKLNILQSELRKYGVILESEVLDICDKSAVGNWLKSVSSPAVGGLDCWIHTIGYAQVGAFAELHDDDFDRSLEINLQSTIRCNRAVLELFRQQGRGKIVNVASVAGLVAAPYLSSYVTAKHGVVGFSRSLQEELRLGMEPVSMMLVNPGFFSSAMVSGKSGLKFPAWLNWALTSPQSVAKEVIRGIQRDTEEITPSLNGKFMSLAHRLLPSFSRRSGKVFLTESPMDALLGKYREP